MKIHIPLISTVFKYYKLYRSYTGAKLAFIIILGFFVGYADGVGITLFFPLLAGGVGAEGEGESSTAMSMIQGVFDVLGLPLNTSSILILILIVFAFKGVVKFVEGTFQSYLKAKLARNLQKQMVGDFSVMDYRYYINKETGFLTNLMTLEVRRVISSFATYARVVSSLLTITALLAVSVMFNWTFTLLAISAGGTVLYLLKFISVFSKKLSFRVSKQNGILQSLLIQTLHSFKYLTSTASFSRLQKKLNVSIKHLAQLQYKLGVASAFLKSLGEPLVVFVLVGILYFQVVIQGTNVESIVIAILLFYRVMLAIMQLQVVWQKFNSKMGGVMAVQKARKELDNHKERHGSVIIDQIQAGIEFRGVKFSYNDKQIFQNLSLKIPKNKTIALVGESGAGKSTFVDLLTGVLLPQGGAIYIDDTNIYELDRVKYRGRIGYVTQETVVFSDTVANNISLWDEARNGRDTGELIVQAAQKAYSDSFINELPEKYDSLIGDRGVKLSGGQRQRLAIARELFKEPQILILDEATSALDSGSERYIQKSIDALKGKMTVVIIAHRLSTIRNSDYIYMLEDGNVIEEGSYEELTSRSDGRFRKMHDMQTL